MRKQFGVGKVAVLLGVVALVAIAFGAYKILFNRSGEAAIQLIPADAKVVFTLDLSPSESQLATFKKISDALEREGIADKMDEMLSNQFDGSPLGRELRPLLARSFAACWLPSGEKSGYALFNAVSDPGRAKSALSRLAKQTEDRLPTYRVKELSQFCSVIGEYLVIADDPSTLARIDGVRSGAEKSLATLPAYLEARKALPSDANLMVFVSPGALQQFQSSVARRQFDGTTWLAIGATVREDGIAFDCRSPVDQRSADIVRSLSEVNGISRDILAKVPSGAYGIIAWSQPAQYWKVFQRQTEANTAAYGDMLDEIKEFEAQSGLSIQDDFVPAFEGNLVVAGYPVNGKPSDMEVYYLVDDANGANPAGLVPKVREWLARQHQMTFVESSIGETTVWEIDPESRRKMRENFRKGQGSSPTAIKITEDGSAPFSPETHRQDQNSFFDTKTLIFATVGNSVVVTSSRDLLSKALDAMKGRSNLLSDAPFAAMSSRLIEGSQANLMLSLHRILEAFRPNLEESMKDSPVKIDELMNVFGGPNTGLVGSCKYDGKVAIANLFLPLDYEIAIHLIGAAGASHPKGDGPVSRLGTRDSYVE